MKFKTTLKAMRENYNVAVFGYCEIQSLLRCKEPIAYNSGIYGWNCDFYKIDDNLVICTGYRPTGERYLPYGRSEEYEKKANLIWSDWKKPYDEKEKEYEQLYNEFCNELKQAVRDSWNK